MPILPTLCIWKKLYWMPVENAIKGEYVDRDFVNLKAAQTWGVYSLKPSSGSKGAEGPCPPPGPVKVSHKKDGCQNVLSFKEQLKILLWNVGQNLKYLKISNWTCWIYKNFLDVFIEIANWTCWICKIFLTCSYIHK